MTSSQGEAGTAAAAVPRTRSVGLCAFAAVLIAIALFAMADGVIGLATPPHEFTVIRAQEVANTAGGWHTDVTVRSVADGTTQTISPGTKATPHASEYPIGSRMFAPAGIGFAGTLSRTAGAARGSAVWLCAVALLIGGFAVWLVRRYGSPGA